MQRRRCSHAILSPLFILLLALSFLAPNKAAIAQSNIQRAVTIQKSHIKLKAAPQVDSVEEWLGIYFGDKKIGSSSSSVTPTTYLSRPALREIGSSTTRLAMLGSNVEEEESYTSITDLDHHPLSQIFDMKSNRSAIHIEAIFDYKSRVVRCKVGSGAEQTEKTLEIPAGANLASDPNLLTQDKHLKLGDKLTYYYLEPLTVSLKLASVEVTGEAQIMDDSGKSVAAISLSISLSTGAMKAWADSRGNMLRANIELGDFSMSMVRETKKHALDSSYVSPGLANPSGKAASRFPPPDFAIATAITPDKPITNPRSLRTLKAVISGITEANLLLSDERQKEKRLNSPYLKNGISMEVEVNETHFDSNTAGNLPLNDEKLAPYLAKAAYLDIDNALIRQTALKIRGSETNLYKISSAIRDWVYAAMVPDPSTGVPRSATDIINRRRGVCRDYATLYTAIARCAGVPTRLCAGIVYADGKFYYHAWAESYVGKWVAFDPTLYDPTSPVDYVDATHIKFAQGDVTGMFDVVSIVGKLHIKIIEADL